MSDESNQLEAVLPMVLAMAESQRYDMDDFARMWTQAVQYAAEELTGDELRDYVVGPEEWRYMQTTVKAMQLLSVLALRTALALLESTDDWERAYRVLEIVAGKDDHTEGET